LRHNDPMRIRREVRKSSPRNLRKVVFVGVTAVALPMTLAACTNGSSAPAAKSDQSSKLSGSASIALSGGVVATYTKHCSVSSDNTPNQVAVAFPNVSKVSGTPLNLVIYAPDTSGSSTYPASSASAAVRLATASSNYSWANSSGTLTVSSGGTAGTIDLTLAPTPASSGGSSANNQATGTVHVQGNWTGCAGA
jgi:hypothetical protein